MKNLLFLLILLSPGIQAQKIIYVRDSTALKAHFIQRPTVALPADPHSANGSWAAAPVVRSVRNDHATILRKELTYVSRNVGEVSFSRANFKAYVNPSGRIDSLAYYLVSTDTARRVTPPQRRDQLYTMLEKDLKDRLEKEWLSVLSEFYIERPEQFTCSGMILMYHKKKNLEEYLNAQPADVKSVDLSDFGLREFPHQLRRFRKLKSINLQNNFIRTATLDKKDYPNLNSLSFQNNLLRDGGLKLTGGLKPEIINLTDNHFTRIPKTHRKVQHLFLANSAIDRISKKDIRHLKNVRSLNLYANKLTEISPRISRLRKLKELDVYRNEISDLPRAITRLKNLETLALSYNKLEELPAEIHKMNKLKTLYSHHNFLHKLPLLPASLETLDVGYNQIQEVTVQVQPLKNLISLDYSHNQVTGDLDFLLELPRIKEIYLLENRYAATEEEEKYFSRVFSTLVSKGVMVK